MGRLRSWRRELGFWLLAFISLHSLSANPPSKENFKPQPFPWE